MQERLSIPVESAAELEQVIAEVRAFGESLRRQREEQMRRREEAKRQIEAQLAGEAAPTLERLRHLAANAKVKRHRQRARRYLDRYDRNLSS